MNRFQHSKIYAIKSPQTNQVYIGSTCNTLAKRFCEHKCAYSKHKRGQGRYISSVEVVRHPDCYIELVEPVNCTTQYELSRKEGQVIQQTPFCVNKRIAGRTRKEFYQAYKEKILGYSRRYYRQNKAAISARRNVSHNCACGGKYTLRNISTHNKSGRHLRSLDIT